ncbi:VOC family protein [Salinibacterium sp. G-O1]|uniref:VOC family protein n=1 Tax=Salinibacterium sp. G-O1 TaxID=3046208 RepID=UPI0024B88C96|nr:VOC family protein [Salinibacterium sp. G-O1]MDJ0334238.1 VOC family protein [Salinibacterium sp. G-O1]
MTTITPYLWFDNDAEVAIGMYSSLFDDARTISLTRHPEGMPLAGTLMTAEFELAGQRFIALNGGPHFSFTEAVSFLVSVESQAEVDRLWDALTADGGSESQCGWLKDRFGLSWQIVPTALPRYLSDPDPEKTARVLAAMMQMRKIVIADLDAAYAG